MRDFEKEVVDFAKFFDEYRKREINYYEELNEEVDQMIKQLEEEN